MFWQYYKFILKDKLKYTNFSFKAPTLGFTKFDVIHLLLLYVFDFNVLLNSHNNKVSLHIHYKKNAFIENIFQLCVYCLYKYFN